MTSLYDAARAGDLERVQFLLLQGEDKDQKFGAHDETPLFAASLHGHFPIVQLLIEQGADMEKTDSEGRSPLYIACRDGHLDIARYLLEQGADRDKACFKSNLYHLLTPILPLNSIYLQRLIGWYYIVFSRDKLLNLYFSRRKCCTYSIIYFTIGSSVMYCTCTLLLLVLFK